MDYSTPPLTIDTTMDYSTPPWTIDTAMDNSTQPPWTIDTTTDYSTPPWTMDTTMDYSTPPWTPQFHHGPFTPPWTLQRCHRSFTQRYNWLLNTNMDLLHTAIDSLTPSWTFYTLLWTLQFIAIRNLSNTHLIVCKLGQHLTTSTGIQSAWLAVFLVVST